jgi:hypothetical protein
MLGDWRCRQARSLLVRAVVLAGEVMSAEDWGVPLALLLLTILAGFGFWLSWQAL